ncbi:hypothetical protein PAXRUDRAFT_825256 [Paxillus rubicundulus Ve08.2h10]|uniref:TRAF-type domain-containing protein n=1 Tax=Paxillus rubicundulus Ve08.2h10 TaxID=930991 RepID=A0A0D0E0T4_9AGAM|nr:hypothetical protein PAXRUDRAFT_825256 [Paxillus rubicundulus Ve08.2h10]
MDDLSPANPIVKHLVDELIVECPQRTAGCPHTCQRQLLESHVKDACQYVALPCSEESCDQLVLRKDRGKHADVCIHRYTQCDGCGLSAKYTELNNHHLECSSKTENCSFCSSEFPRSQLQDHNAACPEVVVPCLHADNGCSWTGPRHELIELHISTCAYESIKGLFAINTARMSTLCAENTALKKKVQVLEGIAHVVQREMQSLKTILGPWYRAEIQRTNHPDDPYVLNQVHNTFQAFARPSMYRTVTRRPQAPFGVDPFDAIFPPSHTIDPEHDPLAPYFPPSPDAVYEAHGRNQIHAHHSSEGMIDMRAQHGERPVPLTPVAPLNLSTSLQGSLVGLRESVAVVSASLDSLARRNDIALTNENMRINEELGSLKYAVHGVRLQLHRLMMDRNAQVTGRLHESASGPGPVPVPAPMLAQPIFHPPMMTPPFPGPPGTKL